MQSYEYNLNKDTYLFVSHKDADGDIEIRLTEDMQECNLYLPKEEIVKLIEFLKAQI